MCQCVGFLCCLNTRLKTQLVKVNLKWTCSHSGPLCRKRVELVGGWSTLTENLPPCLSLWTCKDQLQGELLLQKQYQETCLAELLSLWPQGSAGSQDTCVTLISVLPMHCHSLVLCPSWGWVWILGAPYRGVLRVLKSAPLFLPNNKFSSIKLGHQALFIIWKLQTRSTLMCEPTMRTCCYDNNMRLNHPDRQDTHNCVITCSCLFKGNFISAAEGTLVNKA